MIFRVGIGQIPITELGRDWLDFVLEDWLVSCLGTGWFHAQLLRGRVCFFDGQSVCLSLALVFGSG